MIMVWSSARVSCIAPTVRLSSTDQPGSVVAFVTDAKRSMRRFVVLPTTESEPDPRIKKNSTDAATTASKLKMTTTRRFSDCSIATPHVQFHQFD